jgi:tetratricopeptide (TPR) repeat protein
MRINSRIRPQPRKALPNSNLSGDCREYNQYKTNLHRTFSKLYMLKNDYNESINELQMAIYLDCLKYGPEHPVTSLNYYLMGRIFREQGRVEQCESFFGKLAEIWYRYLKSYFKKSPQQQEQFLVDELVLEEALENLKSVESKG